MAAITNAPPTAAVIPASIRERRAVSVRAPAANAPAPRATRQVAVPYRGWRLYAHLAHRSTTAWLAHRAPTLGAALAFYTAFALAPLLVVVIAVAGPVFGLDTATAAIEGELSKVFGVPAADAIGALLHGAQQASTGVWVTALSLATMLVGATTVVVELQDDLDLIWSAPRRRGSTWLSMLRARVLSLGMMLGIGFLLVVSLAASVALASLGAYAEARVPGSAYLILHGSNTALSVLAITVIFAMLYKWLPNVSIDWRDVWVGAFITALLFSAGRLAIGLYLGRSATASAYGAAGTLVVLLLWLYYSAQIFLLGAEFTCLHAGHRMRHGQSVAARRGHPARRGARPGSMPRRASTDRRRRAQALARSCRYVGGDALQWRAKPAAPNACTIESRIQEHRGAEPRFVDKAAGNGRSPHSGGSLHKRSRRGAARPHSMFHRRRG